MSESEIENAVKKSISRIANNKIKDDILDCNEKGKRGVHYFCKPLKANTRRININGLRKVFEYLNEDYSNYYEATTQAIDNHNAHQFSSKKHVLDSSIFFAKYLIYDKHSIEEETLSKLRQIKLKRSSKPFRPTRTEDDIDTLLLLNSNLKTTKDSQILNAILIKTAFYSGLRLQELCDLKLEDIV